MNSIMKCFVLFFVLSGSVFPGKPTNRLADAYKKAGVSTGDAKEYVAAVNEALRYIRNEEDMIAAIYESIPSSIKNRHHQVKMMESIRTQVRASIIEQGFQCHRDIVKAVLSRHLYMYRCRTVNVYPDQEVRLRDYAGKRVDEILADLE